MTYSSCHHKLALHNFGALLYCCQFLHLRAFLLAFKLCSTSYSTAVSSNLASCAEQLPTVQGRLDLLDEGICRHHTVLHGSVEVAQSLVIVEVVRF